MSNIGMIAHQRTKARGWGAAGLHSVGLLAFLRAMVLAAMVLAAMVLAAASFSDVRADPVINHQAMTVEEAVGAIPTSAVPVTSVASAASSPQSGRAAGTWHRPARAVPAELDSLEPDLVLLGTWTIAYVVGPENGDGANIEIPLRRLDGLVIKPGSTFDFWRAVGEVSRRTGYRRGAVIAGDHIDRDGALAGGICTVSTALFDAAARAGLLIVHRTSHGAYLDKYEIGLDAAVVMGDGFRQTLAFRNDTTEPIVVRTVSTPGIARVDLYAKLALGRRVTFSQPAISHRQHADDRHVASASLPRGQHRRVEPASDGMTGDRDANRPRRRGPPAPPRPLGVDVPSAHLPDPRRDGLTPAHHDAVDPLSPTEPRTREVTNTLRSRAATFLAVRALSACSGAAAPTSPPTASTLASATSPRLAGRRTRIRSSSFSPLRSGSNWRPSRPGRRRSGRSSRASSCHPS